MKASSISYFIQDKPPLAAFPPTRLFSAGQPHMEPLSFPPLSSPNRFLWTTRPSLSPTTLSASQASSPVPDRRTPEVDLIFIFRVEEYCEMSAYCFGQRRGDGHRQVRKWGFPNTRYRFFRRSLRKGWLQAGSNCSSLKDRTFSILSSLSCLGTTLPMQCIHCFSNRSSSNSILYISISSHAGTPTQW